MLAYELYRQNKKSGRVSGKGRPIKKIYVNKGRIQIDDTPIQKYGRIAISSPLQSFLQDTFDMPIDTNQKINLPKKVVASASPKPYVVIQGDINLKPNTNKAKSEKEITGEVTLGRKKSAYAKLSIPSYKIEIEPADTVIKKGINKEDYHIDSTTLYEAYVKNHIIEEDTLRASLFEKIAKTFFEELKRKNVDWPKGNDKFMLYILPNNKTITYDKSEDNLELQSADIDIFGEPLSKSPSGTISGIGFMSYDDKAFPLNCKQKSDFYKNYPIGATAHKKIVLPEAKSLVISKLTWYFFDIEDPKLVFKKRSKGIYDQIYENYQRLKSGKGIDARVLCKAICIKKGGASAKQEVMIDENLSMNRLEIIFRQAPDDTVPFAYELLIMESGSKSMYRYYIQAIKSLLSQTPFDRTQLLKIFTDKIHNNIREWLKPKQHKNALEFFDKAEFCQKTLNLSHSTHNAMNNNEEFAKSVGIMTRVYMDFRIQTGNDNNSLRDLLSKPRYDINTLKSIIKSIGRGVNLLNIPKSQQEEILTRLSNVAPPKDFDDKDLNKDLSYNFYMGYFRRA